MLTEDLGAAPPERPGAGRLLAAAASGLLVIALLVWGLPWATGASWSEIVASLGALPWWSVPAMIVLGAGALLLEAMTVRAAVPGSRPSPVLQGHAASQGAALALPGGSVLGLGLLAWVLRRSGIALPVVLTGILAASLVEMAITSVLVPLLGAGSYLLGSALTPAGTLASGWLWAAAVAAAGAVIALVLSAVLLRRGVLTALLAQADGMLPAGASAEILHQREALVGMLRRRLPALALPTLAARTLQLAALWLAIESVGAEVPALFVLAVFALGRVLALVPLTPGGAGISETVSGAALVGLGVGSADAAAAMLLLLVAMLVVPLLAGAVAVPAALTRTPARR
ncbi:UPF0104 family protein [Brachybacterium paraconglomeratum]|uniref:UPF0104 family protein n=1 Tax=Brachybacterium paraconglomeratum TaxID=173362 RepID=A0A3R8SSU2_9MICO|nr:UPF0104 family protein [Brachybacterium paraconglomeratum]